MRREREREREREYELITLIHAIDSNQNCTHIAEGIYMNTSLVEWPSTEEHPRTLLLRSKTLVASQFSKPAVHFHTARTTWRNMDPGNYLGKQLG